MTTYSQLYSDLYFKYLRGEDWGTCVFFCVYGGCNTGRAVFSVCCRDSSDAIYLNHCDYAEYIFDSDFESGVCCSC